MKIRLDFVEDGSFRGRYYKKGDVCHAPTYYEFGATGRIRLGLVYLELFI